MASLTVLVMSIVAFDTRTASGQVQTQVPIRDIAADATLHSLESLLSGNEFVRIPRGEFMMGSHSGNADEQPTHRVAISSSFEMGKFEVTQAQWEAVMDKPHAKRNAKDRATTVNPSHFKGSSRPVENVSWEAVQEFIEVLNLRDPKHIYRLPTEAEWEYAARAKSTQEIPTVLDSSSWYEANSGGATQPVGQKEPNAWGLHDMLGNVLEWVQDWYAFDSYASSQGIDPKGPASGSYKVYRGCGWLSGAKYCRPSFRSFDFPSSGYYSVGFRLVRSAK